MRIFKDGKPLGRETKKGEWGRSEVKLEKDGHLTFSSGTKDETWSVTFDPDEVEMIITEAEHLNEMTNQELSNEIDRRLMGLRREK